MVIKWTCIAQKNFYQTDRDYLLILYLLNYLHPTRFSFWTRCRRLLFNTLDIIISGGGIIIAKSINCIILFFFFLLNTNNFIHIFKSMFILCILHFFFFGLKYVKVNQFILFKQKINLTSNNMIFLSFRLSTIFQ